MHLCILLVMLSFGFGLSQSTHGLIIDDFQEPTDSHEIKSNGGKQAQWTDPGNDGSYSDDVNVLGGIRDGSLGCESYDNTSSVSGDVGGGTLNVRSAGTSTPSIYLSYDGTRGWEETDLNPETKPFNGTFTAKDFTAYDQITFTFASVGGFEFGEGENGGFNDFNITFLQGAGEGQENDGEFLYTYDAATAGELGGANDLTNSDVTQAFSIDLSLLKNNNDETATFDGVQAVQLHICSEDTKSEYSLDSFSLTAIPEPNTLFLLIVAASAAIMRRPHRYSRTRTL